MMSTMQRQLRRVQISVMVGVLLGFCGLLAEEAGAAESAVFSYTGADQTWAVPAGVTQISVKVWGAGGAGGNYIFNDSGGGGGFVTGTLNVTPGERLTIIVGGGGQPGTGPGAYGGGGGKACGVGGRGGGRSAIRNSSGIELITAGAGGGGGGSATATEARGGGGGGLTGTLNTWPPYNGNPGTQTAGGAGGDNPANPGADGSPGGQFYGGNAGCYDNGYSGSGGSGYFGGGGGTDFADGGGGGGSSLVPTGGKTSAANNDMPGNSSDPDYADNAGHGGPKGGAGNPGRVVILANPLGTTLVVGFTPPFATDDEVAGGMIFRYVQYDASHYRESIAGALRITPRSSGISGLDIDRGEVVMRFSRNNIAYAECTMRRAVNDDFDHFVSVQVAMRSPNSAGEYIIQPISVSAPGNSRSFVSESVAFSADNASYFYKPNDGICNTNFVSGAPATSIVVGIPAIKDGDTADVYIVNVNSTPQPAHVATGVISASNMY